MKRLKLFIKENIVGTILLIIFVFLAFASLATFFKSRDDRFFGTVESLSANSITITDKKVGLRAFLITESTKVIISKKTQTPLTVGQDVIIRAKTTSANQMEALEIRTLGPRP